MPEFRSARTLFTVRCFIRYEFARRGVAGHRWIARALAVLVLAVCGLVKPAVSAEVNVQQIHSFDFANPIGRTPGPLVRGLDGRLYGATVVGSGLSHGGSLFRIDTNSANPEVVVRFKDIGDSMTVQNRFVHGSDSVIYLFAHTVGSSQDGALVAVRPDGTVQTLLTAAAAQTRTWEQLLEGSDGRLYAIAAQKLVRVTRAGTEFEVIHTNQTSSFGPSQPDLLMEGRDGMLYVTEMSGGNNTRGVIYKINKDGSARVVLVDFGAMSLDMGSTPHQLIQGSDGALYGVAASTSTDGSLPALGSPIFRVNPDGTDYTVIARLQNFPVQGANRILREGGNATSFFEGTDGLLYGATQNGSTNRAGLVFRLAKDGSDFTTLRTFPSSYFFFDSGAGVNRTPAKFLVEGLDGRIYGSMSQNALFRFNRDGSNFETFYDFPAPTNEGTNVTSTLALDPGGTLYGTARNGGIENAGTLFKLKSDGSAFAVLRNFGDTQDGAEPHGGVIAGSDGKLYGTLTTGGQANVGSLFRVNKDGNGFEVLRHFQTTGGDGRAPTAPLLEGTDGALYGTTSAGGGAAAGTVFKISKDGSGYQILLRLTNVLSGALPSAKLLEGADGRLYGVTEAGGPQNARGVVFALNKNGGDYALVHRFATNAGGLFSPKGALIQGSDGRLYGTASGGGAGGFGGVFTLRPDGTGFAKLYEFTAARAETGAPPSQA